MMFLPIMALLGLMGLVAANKAKASPGTNAFAADPNQLRALLDQLDDALDQISSMLSAAQIAQLKSYMAPYKQAGQLPPLTVVCTMLTTTLTRDQMSMVVTFVPQIAGVCSRLQAPPGIHADVAPAGDAWQWVDKLLAWVSGAPLTFFRPNVQAELLDLLKRIRSRDVITSITPQSLAGAMKEKLEPAIYAQLLFDLPDLAAAVGVHAEQPITVDTPKEKAMQIATWIKSAGLAPQQDAMLQALLAPYTATGTLPSDSMMCSVFGKVLTADQLDSLSKNVAGFEQACRIV